MRFKTEERERNEKVGRVGRTELEEKGRRKSDQE